MNKVQQKYSVLKVKQYKQEIEDLEKKANINKWFIYGSVGLAVISFNLGNELEDLEGVAIYVIDFLNELAGWAGLTCGLYNLKNMFYNISKKAGLENAINRIEYEMGLPSSKGKYEGKTRK